MASLYELESIGTKNNITIKEILTDSIAQEIGLKPGDEIIEIDGIKIKDELDLHYLTEKDSFILTAKIDGELWDFEIEKDPDEILGIVLEENSVKECKNNCIFCFIDQLPKNLRETLYVKDDDERLSFLRGNYVTLTNLSDEDIERICNYRIPVNISVHSTDPIERKRLLRNRDAGKILEQISRLNECGIKMNAQIVLVPGINDKSLINTLQDLSVFYPNLSTVSVVPVGLTKYRGGLFDLRAFTKEEAREIISKVSRFQEEMLKENNSRFAFLSDEFYLLAKKPLPPADYYEGFKQTENGVGMIREFTDSFKKIIVKVGNKKPVPTLVVTGTAFYPYLKELFDSFYPDIKVIGIENNFFGNNINVTGLLTGKDILNTLKTINLQNYQQVAFSNNLFKAQSDLFLDDLRLKDLEDELHIKCITAEDANELIEAIWS